MLLATPVLRGEESVTLAVRGATVLQVSGATATYSLDPAIAEASIAGGLVTIAGRSAGTTHVVVVTAGGTATYTVNVRPRPGQAAAKQQAASPVRGSVGVDYSSSQSQLQNNVDVVRKTATSTTEVRATAVSSAGRDATFRRLTVRHANAARELTFFDDTADVSPLTLDGINVRGFHLRQSGLQLHAGYASVPVYGSLFLPEQRELAAGASYSWRRNANETWMPSVYVYPGRGSVASLLYDTSRGDELHLRAEVGWGGAFGAAVQGSIDREHERMRFDVRYRPREFASANRSDLHGLYSDASWVREMGRFAFDTAASYNRYELTNFNQTTLSMNGEMRYAMTRRLSFVAGASYGEFATPGAQTIRALSVPAGIRGEFRRAGFTVMPRFTRSSAKDEGSLGLRLSAHASTRALRFSAYADRQEQAPTLQLVLNDIPELALALEQLGLTATLPQDIARLLRENSTLISLGFVEGATVNLTPVRTNASFEASWLGSTNARQQLRLRMLYNRNESVGASRSNSIATLSYSRRLGEMLDVYGAYSMWHSWDDEHEFAPRNYVELGFRHRFDGVPELIANIGSGTISGVVFRDDDTTGNAATAPGVAGVEIELDDSRRALTDPAGKYVFKSVKGGSHKVVARVRDDAAAFFTTRSAAEAGAGDVVNFGLSVVAARATGTVRSDDGTPIAGITVMATNAGRRVTAVTNAEGRFTIATAPGAYDVAVDTGSLPAGFTLAAEARKVTLDRTTPLSGVDFGLRANRSVSGRIALGAGEVEIVELGRKMRTAADGAYAFRSLPAGEVTLIARSGSNTVTRRVTIPAAPAALKGIDLGGAATVHAAAPMMVEASEIETTIANDRGWVVQLGAYRVHDNATATMARARRAGFEPSIVQRSGLTFVELGPYALRADAEARKTELLRSGLEAALRPASGRK